VLVVAIVAAALSYAAVGYSSSRGVACGGVGGAIAWELGGPGRQRAAADADTARMQQGLSDVQRDPQEANTPMGRELIGDAQDELAAAGAKRNAIDECGDLAAGRLARALIGGVLVVGLCVAGWLVIGGLRRALRRRAARRAARSAQVEARCPMCGAVLDDPLGCWRCEAFVDGDRWRRPGVAPPTHERQVGRSDDEPGA
jgi:hypothetical protein